MEMDYNLVGNPYDILGLRDDFTEQELKTSYRNLAMKYHPDRYMNASEEERKEAEEIFKEVVTSYTILSDPKLREEYDNFNTVGNLNLTIPTYQDLLESQVFGEYYSRPEDMDFHLSGTEVDNLMELLIKDIRESRVSNE